MKTCTSPRYDNEHFHLAATPGWHGQFGHLNVLTLDHNDVCTGRGRHDRVVAFCPEGDTLYCRVDHVWGLGLPTAAQVLLVAKATNLRKDMRGNWKIASMDHSVDGKTTEFNFTR